MTASTAVRMAKLSMSDVTKQFSLARGDQLTALEDITFSISEAESVCLVGPSGCGKTTALSLLAGFDMPSQGAVLLDGNPISCPGPDRGVVLQSPALFPWLNARDNIVFGPRHRGERSDDYGPLADEIIDALGLRDYEDFYPYQLSGGMRQRVAIGRALIGRPAVLLCDEPFGALDAQTRLSMQLLILSIRRDYPTTNVFITHDVEEAILLGDRVLVMSPRPGRIVDEVAVSGDKDRPLDFLASEAFGRIKAQLLKELMRGQ